MVKPKAFIMLSKLLSACLLLTTLSQAQQGPIDFEQYNPVSTLVVKENPVARAKFPFIDVHNHQRGMDSGSLDPLLSEMDKLNMQVMVNLSGGTGNSLEKKIGNIKSANSKRFLVFANIDFSGFGKTGWTEFTVKQLVNDVKNGASGLKIFKNLGFSVKDPDGKRVGVDDPRLAPIWEACADLRIPVLIHTADPAPFWDSMDNNNERLLELKTHPRRQQKNEEYSWQQLIDEQHRVFRKHFRTTFIAAHFGWYPNNLGKLDSILTAMPNVVVEFGAVIAELGRQPRAAKYFFNKFQDRILFGKDSWVPSEYATYFRVLETEDEYFPYHKKYHAFWGMYGMGLSDEVLKKIYYKNALRIIPGIDKSQFPL